MKDRSAKYLNYSDLLENLGFPNDPFAKVNADEEERLEEYFIEPPFFKAVYGIPNDPKSYIVFAPRGGGKTALKRKLELASGRNDDYLCVTYNTFDVTSKKMADITLDYHLENIIKLLLIGIITIVDKNGAQKLSKENKQILFFMVTKYYCYIVTYELKDAVESIKSNGQ